MINTQNTILNREFLKMLKQDFDSTQGWTYGGVNENGIREEIDKFNRIKKSQGKDSETLVFDQASFEFLRDQADDYGIDTNISMNDLDKFFTNEATFSKLIKEPKQNSILNPEFMDFLEKNFDSLEGWTPGGVNENGIRQALDQYNAAKKAAGKDNETITFNQTEFAFLRDQFDNSGFETNISKDDIATFKENMKKFKALQGDALAPTPKTEPPKTGQTTPAPGKKLNLNG